VLTNYVLKIEPDKSGPTRLWGFALALGINSDLRCSLSMAASILALIGMCL